VQTITSIAPSKETAQIEVIDLGGLLLVYDKIYSCPAYRS